MYDASNKYRLGLSVYNALAVQVCATTDNGSRLLHCIAVVCYETFQFLFNQPTLPEITRGYTGSPNNRWRFLMRDLSTLSKKSTAKTTYFVFHNIEGVNCHFEISSGEQVLFPAANRLNFGNSQSQV